MPYLTWIDDEDLKQAVRHIYDVLKRSIEDTSLEQLISNVIDPFSLLFETQLSSISMTDWIIDETQRQVQKSMQNAIGEFHEIVLGSVDGWENLGVGHATGLDFKNGSNTIFAEIKNKYNTLNSSSAAATAQKLATTAQNYLNATCYLVHIIRNTKSPYDKLWLYKKQPYHERVRVISGDLFYALVTNRENALHELYKALPIVIQSVVNEEGALEASASTAMRELKEEAQTNNITLFDYFFVAAYPKDDN